MLDFSKLKEQRPEPIKVNIRGVELEFIQPFGFDSWITLDNRCRKMAKVYTTPALCVGDMKDLHLESEEAAFACAILAETSVEPKLSSSDVLRLCKECPSAFAELMIHVVKPMREYGANKEAEVLEDQKNCSEKTPCEDCSCGRAETLGTDTPTS